MRAVRTLLRWLVVTLGVAALVRWLRRRREAPAPPPAATLEDPAGELRRKLAESRATGDEPAPSEPAPASSVEERRADVHAQGRAALAEMTGSNDEG
jgi:hypothetical protein